MDAARVRAEREASGADQPDHAPAPAASSGMASAGPPSTAEHGSTGMVLAEQQQILQSALQSQVHGSPGRRDEGAAQSPDAGTAPPEGPPAHRLPDPAAGDAPETHGRVPEELQQQLQQQPDVGGRRVAEDLADGAVRGQGGAAGAPTARKTRAARRSAMQEKHAALLAQMARETELLSQQASDEDEYAHDLEAHYERLAMVERSVLLRAPPDENADESAVDAGRTAARERRGRDEYARARGSDEYARARGGDGYARAADADDGIHSGAALLERYGPRPMPPVDEDEPAAPLGAALDPPRRPGRLGQGSSRACNHDRDAAGAEGGLDGYYGSGCDDFHRAAGDQNEAGSARLAARWTRPPSGAAHANPLRESEGGPTRDLNGGHDLGRGAPGYPRLGGLGCDDAASNAAPPASFRARAPAELGG